MDKKLGNQTFNFETKPYIIGASSVVGKKEGLGPMNKWFDEILKDDMFGEKTWEKSESKMLKEVMMSALKKAGKKTKMLIWY